MSSFLDKILQTDDTPYSNDYSFDPKAYMSDFDPLDDVDVTDYLGGGSKFNDDGFNLDFLDALYGRSGDISDYSDTSGGDILGGIFGSADSSSDNFLRSIVGKTLAEVVKKGGNVGSGGGGGNLLGLLGSLGLASVLKDRGVFDPKRPNVGYQGSIPKYTATRQQTERDDTGRRPGSGGRRYFSDVTYTKEAESMADGGAVLQNGGYLEGDTDGQADLVPGDIDGVQEARLSHGEYVLPADLVAILGNGNSNAGAEVLDEFMSKVREKATGSSEQQKNIDADEVLQILMKV
jgi:hypothetical protein